jgi:hypothetical protein
MVMRIMTNLDVLTNPTLIALRSNLSTMRLPFDKKTLNKKSLIWLSKNLGKLNKENPLFSETMSLINDCIRYKLYSH